MVQKSKMKVTDIWGSYWTSYIFTTSCSDDHIWSMGRETDLNINSSKMFCLGKLVVNVNVSGQDAAWPFIVFVYSTVKQHQSPSVRNAGGHTLEWNVGMKVPYGKDKLHFIISVIAALGGSLIGVRVVKTLPLTGRKNALTSLATLHRDLELQSSNSMLGNSLVEPECSFREMELEEGHYSCMWFHTVLKCLHEGTFAACLNRASPELVKKKNHRWRIHEAWYRL